MLKTATKLAATVDLAVPRVANRHVHGADRKELQLETLGSLRQSLPP